MRRLRDVPEGELFYYSLSKVEQRSLNLETFFSLAAPAYLKLKKQAKLVSPSTRLSEPIAEIGTGKILFTDPDSTVITPGFQPL